MRKIYKPIKALASVMFCLAAVTSQAQSPYCNSGATTTIDEEIYNVMLNGGTTNSLYSFSNGCSTPAPGAGSLLSRYSNFRTLGNLANLIPGVAATFSVAEDECDGSPYYSNGCAIWIDYNQNGVFTDPGEQVFVENATTISPRNISGTFTPPLTASTGTTVMRVMVAEGYSGSSLTPCLSFGYGETEDYQVNIVPPTPCSGAPAANTLVTGTAAICPNSSAAIALATSYTVIGISYQWASATASVGPYTAIASGTNAGLNTPSLTANTWFNVTATCANGGTTTIGPVQVLVAPVTVSTVPYYEGFEGITGNNKLPNCSWAVSNTVTCMTYVQSNSQNRIPRTGSKFASFYYTPANNNYFYTNGIQLYAGVTYSASMWFTTEYYGYNTYSLTMSVGPNQSPSGLQSVASLSYAASPNYKQLNNTFTVPTNGIYYVAVNAVSNGNCCGYYLSWDDLSITIPCNLNTPTVGLTATGTGTICAGQSVSLTANGANSYTWNTGVNTASISASPISNTMYSVVGTNSLTNCTATVNKNIVVNPSPVVSIVPSALAVCQGSPVNLIALGSATSYTWSSNGSTSSFFTDMPTATTVYSVTGGNTYNCLTTATQTITVNTPPTIQASSSNPGISCPGVAVTLTGVGTGVVNYVWVANSAYVTGNPVSVSPNVNTTYTVTGTDANGCTGTVTVVQQVALTCVGIKEQMSSIAGLNLYPNPNNGEFTIELANGAAKTIEISDITGRIIATQTSSQDKMNLNVSNFANGVYYVKVKTVNASEVLKVVKQ